MKNVFLVSLSFLVGLVSLNADTVSGSPFERAQEKLKNIVTINNQFVASSGKEDFEGYLKQQTPAATIVMCSDSRVQPNSLHDDPKGNLFTIRNIGNQVDNNEGSVDFGVLVLKTPLLLVLGHTGCGAVLAALNGYPDVPNTIKKELDTIDVGNAKDEKQALINNVNNQIKLALKKYADRIKNKELFVVGGIYDIHNMFGFGHGALVFTNVNGEESNIKANELFKGAENLKVFNK